MMRKLLLLGVVFFFSGVTGAFDSATLRIGMSDGRVSLRDVPMERLAEKLGGREVYRVRVPVREIPRDALYVDIVADAAKARKGDAGWYVMPDGSFIEFTQDNGSYSYNRRMSLMGFKTPSGSAAVIVKGLELEFTPIAQSVGGNYELFPRFNIRDIRCDPYEDIVVDFYKLDSGEATYAGVGRVYRDYQLSRSAVRPLSERVKGNETLKKAVDSIYVRMKFSTRVRRGVPESKWAQIPMTVQYTFEDGKNVLGRIKKAGMDDVEFCFVGWQKGGHDGPYPDLFPIPEELGGEAGMKEAIDFGKGLGFRMTLHGNNHDAVQSASRYNKWDVAWDEKGGEFKYTILPGGQVYFTCFQVVHDRWLDDDIAGIKRLGVDGVMHVDVTTARLPTTCNNPLHPNNRSEMAEWQRRVSQKYIDAFGGFSSEGGIDHIAGVTDYALYVVFVGGDFRNPKFVKKTVPLWQIVYHGIIMSGGPFYATIDASYPHDTEKFSDSNKMFNYLGSTENRYLKMIECGGRPSFYYIDYNNKDFSPMKRAYDDYMKLRHLQYAFMDDHREIAKDVFLATYSNGERMVCNYRDTPFEYDGRTVKPKSYELYTPTFWDAILGLF